MRPRRNEFSLDTSSTQATQLNSQHLHDLHDLHAKMVSHITIIPASTQAGKNAIASLLASESGPTIRGIYRDPAKAPASYTQNSRFEAVKGDVTTGDLDFSGTEAVFYTPPPTFSGELDNEEHGRKTARNVLEALKKAGSVKRLVLHSALGAHRDPSKMVSL